jgi:hypothetical protein
MKIHYEIEKEEKDREKFFLEIKKNPKSSMFLDIFDKAHLIEAIADNLKIGEKVILKIDEESEDYPQILKNSPPRFIIQKSVEGEYISLNDYFGKFDKKGFELLLKKEKNDYILEIKKLKEEKLDLKLKLDRDKTIDLRLLSQDKTRKDKVYFGVKSYYYVRKEE